MTNQSNTQRAAFTLVEALVSTSIVVVMLLFMVTVTDQTSTLWKRTRSKVEQFREARAAYDTLTQRLGQATLNTYWDYDKPEFPSRFQRRSELRFTCGQAADLLGPNGGNQRLSHCVFFHAPLGYSVAPSTSASQGYKGLENLLNCWGYYLEYGSDEALRPSFVNEIGLPQRWRFRLMEFALPSENLATYNATSGGPKSGNVFTPNAYSYRAATWFTDPLRKSLDPKSGSDGTVHSLAENIVALILTPRLPQAEERRINSSGGDVSPLAPNYSYDTSPIATGGGSGDTRYKDAQLNPVNQLPPVVQVTMVAIDEDSAHRLGLKAGDADTFKTGKNFKNTANYSKELLLSPTNDPSDTSLEHELISRRVNYRIFTSFVPLRTAKWSRAQIQY